MVPSILQSFNRLFYPHFKLLFMLRFTSMLHQWNASLLTALSGVTIEDLLKSLFNSSSILAATKQRIDGSDLWFNLLTLNPTAVCKSTIN